MNQNIGGDESRKLGKTLAKRTVLNANNGTLGMKHEVKGVIHDELKKNTHKIDLKLS